MRPAACLRCSPLGPLRLRRAVRCGVAVTGLQGSRAPRIRYLTAAIDASGADRDRDAEGAVQLRPRELLEVLRRSRWSDESPSLLLDAFLAHADSLDATSRHHALRSLVTACLRRGDEGELDRLHAILDDYLKTSGCTAHELNSLLVATSAARSYDSRATAQLQDVILAAMRARKAALSELGIGALTSSARSTDRRREIVKMLNAQGYGPPASAVAPTTVAELDDSLERVLRLKQSADDTDLQTILERLMAGSIELSPELLTIVVKHLSLSGAHTQLDDLLALAARCRTPLSPSGWSHYLRHLALTGRAEAACGALASGGGTGQFDLAPEPQRAPRLWTALIDGLNRARLLHGGNPCALDAAAHARHLSRLVPAITAGEVDCDDGLLRTMARALLASGAGGRWGRRQPGDVLSHVFNSLVLPHEANGNSSLGVQRLDDKTWRAYLICAVAEERDDELCRAMARLLASGLTPSSSVVGVFAIGVWEAGDVDLIYDWQRHLEQLGVAWPDSGQVFAAKRHLERRELLLYRS